MLRNKLLLAAVTIATVVALIAPAAMAAEVVQGECVAIDEENKTYTIEVYDTNIDRYNPYGTSTNETIVIDYSKGNIGKDPEIGDILRVAYKVEGTDNMAIRVMNVTKQDIMKK